VSGTQVIGYNASHLLEGNLLEMSYTHFQATSQVSSFQSTHGEEPGGEDKYTHAAAEPELKLFEIH